MLKYQKHLTVVSMVIYDKRQNGQNGIYDILI